ncbi:UreD-domain-containing protein [Tricholoma matsutake]|nr:UreD-domain-containing protein [Tricholoma matsutake 945]
MESLDLIPRIHPGGGRIVLSSYGSNVGFSELSSTYPLKLLAPRITRGRVAVVYLLTYGGGLVGGDRVNLSTEVGSHSILVVLSQGSTKIFKTRPGQRLASVPQSAHPLITTQNMTFHVKPEGALFMLPDPVTCFKSASYSQKQTFHLSRDASLVVLDWFTSGRKTMGEDWAFSRYYSVNEVWAGGKRIAKDIVLLEDKEVYSRVPRTLGNRLAPYSCYAMVILYGPLVQAVIGAMVAQYDRISVLKAKGPPEMLWSLTPMVSEEGDWAVIRVAGKETEMVKKWLGQALGELQPIIGVDMYRRAFSAM